MEKKLFYQPVKNEIRTYQNISKFFVGQEHD